MTFLFSVGLAPDVSYPYCETSTLELISPETWTVMDGYVRHA